MFRRARRSSRGLWQAVHCPRARPHRRDQPDRRGPRTTALPSSRGILRRHPGPKAQTVAGSVGRCSTLGRDFFVEDGAKAWPIRQLAEAILELRNHALMHIHVGLVRVVASLLNVEVRRCRVEMEVGKRAHRALRTVWGHPDTVRRGNRCDLARFGNAARGAEVRLGEVDQVARQVRVEAVNGLHPLARRDWCCGVRTQVGPILDVVHLQGFFDPEQIAILDAAHQLHDVRRRHGAGAM